MTLSVSHVLLLSLVAVVTTAAPVAEENQQNKEQAVNLNGDSSVGDRAKRAKEEIVFGNQQNGGRAPGLAKKSFDLTPTFMASQDMMMPGKFEDPNTFDKSGYLYAEREQPVPFEMLPSVVGESKEIVEEARPVLEESKTVVEEAKPVEEEVKTIAEEAKPVVEEAKAIVEEAKPVVEEVEETKVVEPAAAEIAEEAAAAEEPGSAKPVTHVEELVVPESDIAFQAAAAVKLLPEDSKDEDAEEVLEGQRQQAVVEEEADDVEDLLKELREENKAEVKDDVMEGEAEEEELKEKESEVAVKEKGEQEDEADLQQVSGDMDQVDLDGGEYSRNLLQLLLDEDRMYRMPYPYYPAYLQRRRRSLAKRRLPHIHSRHRSKQLARAKRTKRDLLDDDLYYNDEDEEFNELPPEVSESSLEDLMAYLLALYPSLYELQSSPQVDYPGYKWFGSGYPEDSYPGPEVPALPEWEEPEYEPEYVEVPAEYEPARWEPVYFPEPVEEESPYYQPPAKRQMLSFVPGSRRKRYFFPFAREPYTHWGAFVPAQEKRSYEDAYRRLRELAVVLADARNPSYADAFEEYRKKK